MITGELESLYGLKSDNEYDHFFKKLFGKKKRKKKKNAFWEKVRLEYENGGKLEGILHTASDIEAYLKYRKEQRDHPSDFKIRLGNKKKDDKTKDNAVKIIGYSVFALAFTGMILFANHKLNNSSKSGYTNPIK